MKEFLVILLLLPNFIYSQYVPKVINFSNNDYHALFQNWDIDISSNNDVYIANNSGILCFNGAEWDVLSLPHRKVVRSIKFYNNKIFTGSYGDFGYFYKNLGGNYLYKSLIHKVDYSLSLKEEIWRIIEYKKALFFQSFSTIYKYNNDTINYSVPPGNIMFLNKANNKILFQVINDGIYELVDIDQYELIKGSKIFSDKKVIEILDGPDNNNILIFTENNGIYIYQKGKFFIWNNSRNISNSQLNKVIKTHDGNYVLGTIQNGIFILNNAGKEILHLNKNNGLQNNTILSLGEDKLNNIWVGTDKGIDLVDLKTPLKYYKDNSDKIGTLYDMEIENGLIYIGTNKGLFYSPKDKLNFKIIENTKGQVWELKKIDNTLFCGHNKGTFIVNGKKADKISEINGGWNLIPAPNNKNLLIQATYTGLSVYKKSKNKWQKAKHISGFDFPVNRIVFDSFGNLWATHPVKSIFKIKLNNTFDKVLDYNTYEQSENKELFYVKILKYKKKIYFKSENKYYSYNVKNDSIYKVKERILGPFSDNVNNILYFDSLNIFYVYDQYILYKKQENTYKLDLELLPEIEEIKEFDNQFYFCLDNSFAVLDKDRVSTLNKNDYSFPQIYKIETLGDSISEILNIDEKVVLKPSQNNIKIYFTNRDYTQKPFYDYRFKGYSNQWNNLENKNNIQFYDLKKGNYKFEIKPRFSNRSTQLQIQILPHWYQRPFAIISGIFLFVALLYLFYILLERRFNKEKEKLEREKREQLERQYIKTQNKLLEKEILQKSKDLANASLNLARKNEILSEILEKLQKQNQLYEQGKKLKMFPIIQYIKRKMKAGDEWLVFENTFNEIHEEFFINFKKAHPEVTNADLKLAAMLKMDLSSKDIAPLMRISIRGVENKRYRLRKKLSLKPEIKLKDYVKKF